MYFGRLCAAFGQGRRVVRDGIIRSQADISNPINPFSEFFARLEDRYLSGSDGYRFADSRIPALPLT